MVSGFLFDSDWIIDALNGIDHANQLIFDVSDSGVAVSLVSYAELYQGAYYSRDRDAALHDLRNFLSDKTLLPITADILERFAVVRGTLTRHIRKQIGDLDLIIAATALTYDLTLVTRNLRDFRHIPDLAIYEPEAEEESPAPDP